MDLYHGGDPTVCIASCLLGRNERSDDLAYLSEPERAWLTSTLAHQRRAVERRGKFSVWRGITT